MRVPFLKKGLCSLGLLAAMLFTFSGCEIEDPDFTNLRGVKLIKMDGKRLDLEFTVDCDNPNGFGFKVKRSVLNISVDDDALGVITLDKKIKIKRKSKNSYTVPVSVELENGALLRLVKYVTRKEVTVKIEGKVRGSVYGVSKSMNVSEIRTIDGSMFNLNNLGE